MTWHHQPAGRLWRIYQLLNDLAALTLIGLGVAALVALPLALVPR